ncbi:guanosine-5'-triphosphate,3'-diphosphate pyrophosphatase, partial [Vibrio parahaemolyticus]|nr:guanosine-5'-triphosphate,3'-diphosphate pyrophosphatase [Vibrio parahaemolyticus]
IDFKKGGEHSAYLLQNLDLPGYTRAQKFFIGEVARRYREQLTSLPEQHALSGSSAKRVLRLLRLAVLLSHRRNPDLEPNVTLTVEGDNLTLHIDAQWLEKNPLTAAELEIESNRQTDIGWPLNIVAK